jgi:hypothetical protein
MSVTFAFSFRQFYRIDFFIGDYAVEDLSEPEGLVAETIRPRLEDGEKQLSGHVLKGEYVDYMVAGAWGTDFMAMHLAEHNE